ncbi:unnamed protein product [Discosporangium mesarthrocarpum]
MFASSGSVKVPSVQPYFAWTGKGWCNVMHTDYSSSCSHHVCQRIKLGIGFFHACPNLCSAQIFKESHAKALFLPPCPESLFLVSHGQPGMSVPCILHSRSWVSHQW